MRFLRPHPDVAVALALAVLALVLFGLGAGSYALWDPWEPKYALAIQEMRERGDYITPWLDGKVRWTKPALFYWALLGPTALLGDTELAVRLPSVLAGAAGVAWTCFVIARLRGRRSGWLAAAILATLPQYYAMARQAMPDMLLTLFLAVSLGSFALARFGGSARAILGFWAGLGLAFLTKGPVACAMVFGALAIFAGIDVATWLPAWRAAPVTAVRDLLRRYRAGVGVGIFLAISGPWYVAMLARHGAAFVQNFVLDENLQRFQEPLFGHVGDARFYLSAVIHGQYPWSCLLPIAVLFLFHGSRGPDEELRQRWFFFSWFAAVFLLFTIAGTKLDHYALPLTVPSAVLVTLAWEARFAGHPWLRPAFVLAIVAAYLPLRDFVFESNSYLTDSFMPEQEIVVLEREIAIVLWIGFTAWALVLAAAAVLRRPVLAAWLAIGVAAGQAAYVSQRVMPAVTRERSLKSYAELYDRMREPDAELVFYGRVRHTLLYYHDRNVEQFEPEQTDALIEYVKQHPTVYIVAQEMFFDEMIRLLERSTARSFRLVSDEHPQFYLVTNAGRSRPGGAS